MFCGSLCGTPTSTSGPNYYMYLPCQTAVDPLRAEIAAFTRLRRTQVERAHQ